MSFARWGVNGSDVYVFLTSHEGKTVIECCGCKYTEEVLAKPYTDMFGIQHTSERYNFYADKRNRMIEHLWQHRKDGDIITDDTLQQLIFRFPDGEKLVDEYEKEDGN